MKRRLNGSILVGLFLALSTSFASVVGQQARTSPEATTVARVATFPVEETTVRQLHAAYLAGKTTAHQVTQAYIDRIAAYDKRGPYLNSLISVNQHALADADKLDARLTSSGELTGSLHGIPIIVKDNLDT